MKDNEVVLESGEFIRRNLAIHKGVNTVESASEKAIDLAQDVADLINEHEVSYLDINQAVILVDNGFYEQAVRNDLNRVNATKIRRCRLCGDIATLQINDDTWICENCAQIQSELSPD